MTVLNDERHSPHPFHESREPDELKAVAQIVGSYVGNNRVSVVELPKLIEDVRRALGIDPKEPATDQTPVARPAVAVAQSVSAEAVTCLVCGKRFKSIRRHLSSAHGLTAAQYLERWGLPSDYPLVAPNYSALRARLVASTVGRGRASPAGRGRKRPAR